MNSSILYNLLSTNLKYTLPKPSDSNTSFSQPVHIAQNAMCDEGKPEIQIPTEAKIKRPPNSFIVWSTEKRKKIYKEFPHMHNSEISKQLGEIWKTVPQKTKIIYKMKAEELKIKHQKKYPNYKYQPQRRKKKLSLQNSPIIKLFNDKFDSPIPNVVPNPYYKEYTNNYAPHHSNATTTTPLNNNTYNNASAAAFANNLLYPNYYTPHSSLMSFPTTTEPTNMPYWTLPSASDHKSENHDVCGICVSQNSSQLTPSGNQPTRTPLSEYNQQQNIYGW